MKKFTPIEETSETIKILEQKDEINGRVKYYKDVMLGLDGVMNAIDKRLAKGYTTETFKFLGVPVNKRILLDDYDKSKLIVEKKRVELELFEKKNYYDRWMERKRQYDIKFSELEKECDENYDNIEKIAQDVRKYNIRLSTSMDKYENKNNDKKLKVEFYLYMKQEVENAIKSGRIKIVPPTPQPENKSNESVLHKVED